MKKTRDTLPPPGGRRAKPKKVSPLQYHYGFSKP